MLPFHKQEQGLFALSPLYSVAAAALHQISFDFPWNAQDFTALFLLPSTKGWMNSDSLLLCSCVLDEMEILTLCVHPSARRQGKAEALLARLVAEAEKLQVKRIFLEVSVENKPAVLLYEKMGFSQIGKRQNYYRTKQGFCDALCYEKKLF